MPKRCRECSQIIRNEQRWLRHPKPSIDFRNNEVWATVRCPECPEYTQPVGGFGNETGNVWERGETLQIFVICDSPCGNYVSALTGQGGWINIWCIWNVNARRNIGANFCHITTSRRS